MFMSVKFEKVISASVTNTHGHVKYLKWSFFFINITYQSNVFLEAVRCVDKGFIDSGKFSTKWMSIKTGNTF